MVTGARLVCKLLSASIEVDDTKSPPYFQRGELCLKGPLMEAAFEPADCNFRARLLSRIPQPEFENYLWTPPQLRIYVRGYSERDFILARIALDPDDVREWDRKWYSYFAEVSEQSSIDDVRLDVAKWEKLMKKGDGKPLHIFLLPVVAVSVRTYNGNDGANLVRDDTFTGLILSLTGTADDFFRRLGTFSLLTDYGDDIFSTTSCEKDWM
jgi:hypothetical protein